MPTSSERSTEPATSTSLGWNTCPRQPPRSRWPGRSDSRRESPPARRACPVASVMDGAQAAEKGDGFFKNGEQPRDLDEPGSVGVAYLRRDCYSAVGDQRIAAVACEHLRGEPLDFAFVYFGWADE